MKRITLLTLIVGFVFVGFAQRPNVSNNFRNQKAKGINPTLESMNLSDDALPLPASKLLPPEEDDIGNTFYDLQSNGGMQNRLYIYEDGTVGSAFTMGFSTGAFSDRGTGYNYKEGGWGEYPTERIEPERTGWPAYAPWGEDGEIIVSHYSGAPVEGLIISRRNTKGTGAWTQVDFHSPASNAEYLWPRMTTGGIDNSVVHVVAITMPTFNDGAIYEGLNGAILYSRSADGGDTWDIEHELFDEMSSDFYKSFRGDTYEIQVDGDNVAILYGDSWANLGLMKSIDGGDTWTQTIIWENYYDTFDPLNPIATDAFYCPDGAHSLDFDQSGKVHIAFGINRASCDGSWPASWYPGVGGIGYWNEDRPTFSNDTMSLCPFSDCEYSELEEDYSLIGWMQDLNENDTIDIEDPLDLAKYYLGTSSMPQIHVDDQNRIFVVFSSITEGYTGGITNQTYRHLWCRTSPNGEWWGKFTDLTSSLEHVFDECVFPSIASYSDDYFYLTYQRDDEPGLHIAGDEDPVTDNTITYMAVNKEEVWTSVKENSIPIFDFDVSQNYPNPFTGTSVVKVNVRQSTVLSLEIVNMMGQKVYTVETGIANRGMNEITIDASNLTTGIYFYTVRAGETAITKKMIVE